VGNKIGAAIAQRIIRAYQNGEDFHVIVCMPAVPAFAGDLKADGALGTRAIMEYQYKSISRGGHSIIETVSKAGVPDPSQYISFYNLRNFDRINGSAAMGQVEQASGVSYEAARKGYDDTVETGYDGSKPYGDARLDDQYRRYEAATKNVSDPTWDTVAACYMDAGPDLAAIPWNGSPEA
jgi:phospholipase D1/2